MYSEWEYTGYYEEDYEICDSDPLPRPPVKNGNGSCSLNLTRRADLLPWYTSGFQ